MAGLPIDPGSMSGSSSITSSSSEAGALVSTQQSPRLLKLLRKVCEHGAARAKLADLRKYLAAGGNPNAVVYYVKDGGQNSMGDYVMRTLLAVFSEVPRLDAMTAILDAGADPNVVIDDVTALEAASAGCPGFDAMQLLLSRGADVNAGNGLVLQSACLRGRSHVVEFLIANGADINQSSIHEKANGGFSWSSALSAAALGGHLDLMINLHNKGAYFVVASDRVHSTALHASVSSDKSVPCTQWLLQTGYHVDSRDSKSRTPLHDASRFGSLENMQVLLAAGANIFSRSDNDQTP